MECSYCKTPFGPHDNVNAPIDAGVPVMLCDKCMKARGKNRASNEINQPKPKGITMADPIKTEPIDAPVPANDQLEPPTTTWLQDKVNRHPRAAKAVAITGAVLSAIGVVQVGRTINANRSQLDSAATNAGELMSDLGQSVTPQSTDS